MKRASVVMSVMMLMIGAEVSAQSWSATTESLPSNHSSCPKPSATIEFTIAGTELSAKVPSGDIHRGVVASDGAVSLQYASAARAIGQITISGNVRSRALQLVASGAPSCIYALVPEETSTAAVAPSAYQGPIGDWALGHWSGQIVRNFQGVGLQAEPRSLMVARMPDGRIGCRWAATQVVAIAGWAPKCTIDTSTITLTSAENSFVELRR